MKCLEQANSETEGRMLNVRNMWLTLLHICCSVYRLGWGNVIQRRKCTNITFGKGKSSGMEIIDNKAANKYERIWKDLMRPY